MTRTISGAWLMMVLAITAGAALAAQPPAAEQGKDDLPALKNTSVNIPWQELRALLERARPSEAEKPPVEYLFSSVDYSALVVGDRVTTTVTCEVTTLNEKWTLVELGPAANEVVGKVTVDGEPCPLVMKGDSLYALLSGAGKKKLLITMESPVTPDAGGGSFAVWPVPGPGSSFSVTIPQVGLEVSDPYVPLLKVQEANGATTLTGRFRGGHGRLVAVFSWKPRPPKAEKLPTRIYAETQTLVSIENGLLRCKVKVAAQIMQTPARELKLALDPQAVVLGVTGKDVDRWTQKAGKDANVVTVIFTASAVGLRDIELAYDRDLPEEGGELAVQVVRVDGANRDRGTIGIRAVEGFEVRPLKTNATRIGVSDLVREQLGQVSDSLQFGYKYTAHPVALTLGVVKAKQLPASIYANTATGVVVESSVIRCRATITYDVLRSGVESLRVALPDDVEILQTEGAHIRQTEVVKEGGKPVLLVALKDIIKGPYMLMLVYEKRLKEKADAADVPLVSHPDAVQDRGSVGVEVRGGLEVTSSAAGAERVDVKDLPGSLWERAGAPLIFGYKYTAPAAKIALKITKHQDIDVLVAMSDICEASTVVTPDGKVVTKMMFILRNNRKQFMTLDMPKDGDVWSTFVNDRPVTPVRNAKGQVLIPLQKSEEVDEDEDEDQDDKGNTYRARREQRRNAGPDEMQRQQRQQAARNLMKKEARQALEQEPARDLKPYDVEIVFVSPNLKLDAKGDLKLALPKSDIPTGQMAWAVFLPENLRVLDAAGNFKWVNSFSLPFRHFGEAEYIRQGRMKERAAAAQMQKALDQAREAVHEQVQEAAKAQGVLPVRIEIPIVGEIHRFEKFLVADEMLEVTITYRKKTE